MAVQDADLKFHGYINAEGKVNNSTLIICRDCPLTKTFVRSIFPESCKVLS